MEAEKESLEKNVSVVMPTEIEQTDGDEGTVDSEMSADETDENELLDSDIDDEEFDQAAEEVDQLDQDDSDEPVQEAEAEMSADETDENELLDSDIDEEDEEELDQTAEEVDQLDQDDKNNDEPVQEADKSLTTDKQVDADIAVKVSTKTKEKEIERKMKGDTAEEETPESIQFRQRGVIVYPVAEDDLEGPVLNRVLRLAPFSRFRFRGSRGRSKKGVLDMKFMYFHGNSTCTSKDESLKLLTGVKLRGGIQPKVVDCSDYTYFKFRDELDSALMALPLESLTGNKTTEDQPVSMFVNNIPLDIPLEMLHFLYPSAGIIQLPINGESAVQGYAIIEFPNLNEAKTVVKNNRAYPAQIGGKYLNMFIIGHEGETGKSEPHTDKVEKKRTNERSSKSSERSQKRSFSESMSRHPKRSRQEDDKRSILSRRSSGSATKTQSRTVSNKDKPEPPTDKVERKRTNKRSSKSPERSQKQSLSDSKSSHPKRSRWQDDDRRGSPPTTSSGSATKTQSRTVSNKDKPEPHTDKVEKKRTTEQSSKSPERSQKRSVSEYKSSNLKRSRQDDDERGSPPTTSSGSATKRQSRTVSDKELCPKGDKTVQVEQVCKHWLRGFCKKGDDCEFLHEKDMSKMPECLFFSRFGYCKKKECPYLHTGLCSNKECPFLRKDPEKKIKDCPCLDLPTSDPVAPAKTEPIVCRNCLETGHEIANCPNTPILTTSIPNVATVTGHSNSGKGKRPLEEVKCFKCLEMGHYSSKCKNKVILTLDEVKCFKCGEMGHYAKNCPEGLLSSSLIPKSDLPTSDPVAQAKKVSIVCSFCLETGHLVANCPNTPNLTTSIPNVATVHIQTKDHQPQHQHQPQPYGGYSNPADARIKCFKCGEMGHYAHKCAYSLISVRVTCYKCGEKGHYAKDCPVGLLSSYLNPKFDRPISDPVAQAKKASIVCRFCLETGHIVANCPNTPNFTTSRTNVT